MTVVIHYINHTGCGENNRSNADDFYGVTESTPDENSGGPTLSQLVPPTGILYNGA